MGALKPWHLLLLVAILLAVLAVAVVVIVVSLLITRRTGRTDDAGRQRSPREILEARLAAGEIGPEEYERVRRTLES